MPRPKKYHVPLQALRRRILGGIYSAGERLPTEQQLCDDFSLSRTCIRKALAALQEEALIVSEPGNGHFANPAGTDNEPSCQDTALLMPISFTGWDIDNTHCMLYMLLEQHVAQHGSSFTHIQFDLKQTTEELVAKVVDSKAPWVIIDIQATFLLPAHILMWHLLEDVGCRVVTTGFVGSSFTTTFDQVGTDWARGTRTAVQHLLGRGFQRIFFAGYDGVDWSDDRQAAFLAELVRAGTWKLGSPLPCIHYPGEIDWSRPGRPVEATAAIAAAHVLDVLKHEAVDALICANDELAKELSNLAPLEDLPVLVGFDNSPWSKEHGVSSVGMNLRSHADRVFELLAEAPHQETRMARVPTIFNARQQEQTL